MEDPERPEAEDAAGKRSSALADMIEGAEGAEDAAPQTEAELEKLLREARHQVLEVPIPMGDSRPPITELKYAALRGKFMRQMPVGHELQVGDMLDLAAALSTQPARVFEQMDPADVRGLILRMSLFLAPGRRSGGGSTPA